MELVGPHAALKLGALDDLAHKGVRIEKDVVIKEDIVNPNHPMAMKIDIVKKRGPGIKFHVEPVMNVVVQIGPSRDDPINKARLHQGDEAGLAQPRRSQGAG